GGGTILGEKGSGVAPIRRRGLPTPGSRAVRPPAIPAKDHQPGQPPRPATNVARRTATSPAVANSAPRFRRTEAQLSVIRIRQRAGSDSARAATPTGRADSHAS